MPEYIIAKNGCRVHIIGKADNHTLCGIKTKYDYYMRYPAKADRNLETCRKCEQIIIEIVNA